MLSTIAQLMPFNSECHCNLVGCKFLKRAVSIHPHYSEASSVLLKCQHPAGQIRTAETHSGWSRIGTICSVSTARLALVVLMMAMKTLFIAIRWGKGWVLTSALSLPCLVDSGSKTTSCPMTRCCMCSESSLQGSSYERSIRLLCGSFPNSNLGSC